MRSRAVVPDQCAGQVTEERVTECAFNLLFAFDEAITPGGYKEQVTLVNIKTNLVCVAVFCFSSSGADRVVLLPWH